MAKLSKGEKFGLAVGGITIGGIILKKVFDAFVKPAKPETTEETEDEVFEIEGDVTDSVEE